MATTTSDLAADLGINEGDVDVVLELFDERGPELDDDDAEFLRRVFDPQRVADRAGGPVLARGRRRAATAVRARRPGSDGAVDPHPAANPCYRPFSASRWSCDAEPVDQAVLEGSRPGTN